jgi:hypothetical protein
MPVIYQFISVRGVKILADLANRYESDKLHTPIQHIQHIEFDFGRIDKKTCDLIQHLLKRNLASLETITLDIRFIEKQTFLDLTRACGQRLVNLAAYLTFCSNMSPLDDIGKLRCLGRLSLHFELGGLSWGAEWEPPEPLIMPAVEHFAVQGCVHTEVKDFLSRSRFHPACYLSILLAFDEDEEHGALDRPSLGMLDSLFEEHTSPMVVVDGIISSTSTIFARSKAVRLVNGMFPHKLFQSSDLPQDIFVFPATQADFTELWNITHTLLDRKKQDHLTRIHIHGLQQWLGRPDEAGKTLSQFKIYQDLVKSVIRLPALGIILTDSISGRDLELVFADGIGPYDCEDYRKVASKFRDAADLAVAL